MQNAVPFLRTVAAATASQPASRIPHISHHIQKRTRLVQTQKKAVHAPIVQSRFQSTTIHAQHYIEDSASRSNEQTSELADSISSNSAQIPATITQDGLNRRSITRYTDVNNTNTGSSILHSEEQTNVYTILEHGQPDRILFALLDDSIGLPFLRYAPQEHFDEALLSIDPEYFIQPMKNIYRFMLQVNDPANGVKRTVRDLDERFENFTVNLNHIISTRRDSGSRLSLNACRHLLKCAAYLGDRALANIVMYNIMVQDNVEPDLACYNYLMEASNWYKAYNHMTKFGHRVIPRNTHLRATFNPPEVLSGYKTLGYSSGPGVRQDMLRVFTKLVERGFTANESTYVNLMISMGRENDISGVKSVLKSVWNIDVDLLEAYDEEEIESPTYYEQDSPLHPSEKLLQSVVHIFGSNNDARTAWLLLDYVSRNYNIEIPKHVWYELLEWYLVLSLSRSGVEKGQGRTAGQIPAQAYEQLYTTMVDEPYKIATDATCHYMNARSSRGRRLLSLTLEHIRYLGEATARQRSLVSTAQMSLIDHLKKNRDGSWTEKQWQRFLDLRHKFLLRSLKFESTSQLMFQAVRQNLLREKHFSQGRKNPEWACRRLPTYVQEFVSYLPNTLDYHTPTGIVELECKEHREAARNGSIKTTEEIMKIVWKRLDTEDFTELVTGMDALRGDSELTIDTEIVSAETKVRLIVS